MPRQPIPFELHLTIHNLLTEHNTLFTDLCARMEGKPLMIELARGVHIHQPMFSKVVYENSLEEALNAARTYTESFQRAGFHIGRLKIEVPARDAAAVNYSDTDGFSPYYEWHGKIALQDTAGVEQICAEHDVHLSVNALKGHTGSRFITLRSYTDGTTFEQRVDNLIQALTVAGFPVMKQQAEYCIYDNNISLDNGWLTT